MINGMRPKIITWINPKEGVYLSADGIPQVLYRIRLIAPFKVGLFFHHGYENDYDKCLIAESDSVDECKVFAQQHWDKYVIDNFLEYIQ